MEKRNARPKRKPGECDWCFRLRIISWYRLPRGNRPPMPVRRSGDTMRDWQVSYEAYASVFPPPPVTWNHETWTAAAERSRRAMKRHLDAYVKKVENDPYLFMVPAQNSMSANAAGIRYYEQMKANGRVSTDTGQIAYCPWLGTVCHHPERVWATKRPYVGYLHATWRNPGRVRPLFAEMDSPQHKIKSEMCCVEGMMRRKARLKKEGWWEAFSQARGRVGWQEFDALFVGGSTEWKEGETAVACIKAAQKAQKHIHVGRVNWHRRYKLFAMIGGSDGFTCDGTRQRYEGIDNTKEAWAGYQQTAMLPLF